MSDWKCKLLRGHRPETSITDGWSRTITCSDCDAWWMTWEGAYFDARRAFLKRLAKAPNLSETTRMVLQARGILPASGAAREKGPQ